MKKVYWFIAGIFILSVILISGYVIEKNNSSQEFSTITGNVIKVTDNSLFIAKLSDLPSGSIKKFTYNDEPAILVNFNGELKAYVNKCPHKGLQFNESSLVNDRIQCPWHGATFKPTTGEYLGSANGQNYGLNGLTLINLNVKDNNIYAE